MKERGTRVTLCQKCRAENIDETIKRPKCRNCGASGYISFLYECGFCGVEKSSTDWCKNPNCHSDAKGLTEGTFFFLCPIRPYYRGVFSYKIALYPYALVFAITVLPILIAITFLGIMYGILLLYLYSKLTKRAYGKEEDRDNALRKQVPSNTATKTSLPSQS